MAMAMDMIFASSHHYLVVPPHLHLCPSRFATTMKLFSFVLLTAVAVGSSSGAKPLRGSEQKTMERALGGGTNKNPDNDNPPVEAGGAGTTIKGGTQDSGFNGGGGGATIFIDGEEVILGGGGGGSFEGVGGGGGGSGVPDLTDRPPVPTGP